VQLDFTTINKMNQRLQIVIRGAVQGVGFRPFIYRIATDMMLNGWVLNSTQGVFIEVEGVRESLERFILRVEQEKPPRSFIQSFEYSYLDPIGFTTFEIKKSKDSSEISALILPDIAVCPDCIEEIFDPNNRRYHYPFTNCTNCGPRFSIIEKLPYDRQNTSMKKFKMCTDCLREYEDPLNRRFHAQPNACPKCGPHLELWDESGKKISNDHDAMQKAVEQILSGKIVAIKGIGGFHLMVDARNDSAILRLRERKHREEKPFALMYPSMKIVKQDCEVSNFEERMLCSPESPIVLLKRKRQTANLRSSIEHITSNIVSSVAPNNPYLGVMLPYTPLHHLLMMEIKIPVIATSGNLSDEPICTDENEAVKRLHGIADYFLVHNRMIVRHVDDSIARILGGRESIIRRARGYAPLPIHSKSVDGTPLLAVGAHLKNSIALKTGENIFICQHIGDLETPEAFSAFEKVIQDFKNLYKAKPTSIVSDLHPEYISTDYAKKSGMKLTQIQHHLAHVMSCIAENQIDGNVLGVSWDGAGFGTDGTIWGGEFLLVKNSSFERIATFRKFKLLGGDRAVKEPRRIALSIVREIFKDGDQTFENCDWFKSFSTDEIKILEQMLRNGVQSPSTSSVGRLFDGVASLLGIRNFVSFEGQAAIELEFATHGVNTDEYYNWKIEENKIDHPKFVINWEVMIKEILLDIERKESIPVISTRFHNSLVEIIVDIAKRVGETKVVLSGGCFQNVYLTERIVRRLREEGFQPYWHQRIPTNDGGIALGQIWAAQRILK
jgi:hydrogenase maturation protein HypF